MTPAELGLTKEEAGLVQTWHAEEVARVEQLIKDEEASAGHTVMLGTIGGPDELRIHYPGPDLSRLAAARQYLASLRAGWQRSLFSYAKLMAHRDAQAWTRLSPEEQAKRKADQLANFIAAGYGPSPLAAIYPAWRRLQDIREAIGGR